MAEGRIGFAPNLRWLRWRRPGRRAALPGLMRPAARAQRATSEAGAVPLSYRVMPASGFQGFKCLVIRVLSLQRRLESGLNQSGLRSGRPALPLNKPSWGPRRLGLQRGRLKSGLGRLILRRGRLGLRRSESGLPRSLSGLPRSLSGLPRCESGLWQSKSGLRRSLSGLRQFKPGLP